MGTTYVVRHAEAAGDEGTDPGLSADGTLQAEALGRRLAHLPVKTVLHSPRRRARATAEIVAAHLPEARVAVSELLDDRTAVPSPSRLSDYPAHRHGWFAGVPAEERDVDGAAMTAAWQRLVVAGGDGDLLLVTHAFVVAWWVRETLGAPPAAWLRLPVANAGLTIVGRDRQGEPTLETFSSTDHLAVSG